MGSSMFEENVLHYCIYFGDTVQFSFGGEHKDFSLSCLKTLYALWCIVLEVLTRKLILSFEAFIQITFK